jgi:hypothetical protein
LETQRGTVAKSILAGVVAFLAKFRNGGHEMVASLVQHECCVSRVVQDCFKRGLAFPKLFHTFSEPARKRA